MSFFLNRKFELPLFLKNYILTSFFFKYSKKYFLLIYNFEKLVVFILVYFYIGIINHTNEFTNFLDFILSLHDRHHNQEINYYT